MKKLKGVLLALSLILISGVMLLRHRPLHNSPLVVLAEEPSEEEVISEEEPGGENILVDANGNGIPDVLEDYYANNIRDQYIFGISLGAIISGAVTIAGYVYIYMKNRAVNNEARTNNKEIKQELKELREENANYRRQIAENEARHAEEKALYRETLVKQDEANKIISKEFSAASKRLEAYGQFEQKIDSLLAIETAKASDPDLVKKGIAETVIKIAKGVK